MIQRDNATPPVLGAHPAVTGAYTIDPVHSTIGFSVRHAMITNVRGRFDRFEGLLVLDGADPSRSKAYVSVQTDSMDTGAADRDAHLAGPDFFDSATFPLMTFHSMRHHPARRRRVPPHGQPAHQGHRTAPGHRRRLRRGR